jgi:hypothetical protein
LDVAVSRDGSLVVAGDNNRRVVVWKVGALRAFVAAGGNGRGNALNQLDGPTSIAVGRDASLYIADSGNRRVVRWMPGASQGIVVARHFDDGREIFSIALTLKPETDYVMCVGIMWEYLELCYVPLLAQDG